MNEKRKVIEQCIEATEVLLADLQLSPPSKSPAKSPQQQHPNTDPHRHAHAHPHANHVSAGTGAGTNGGVRGVVADSDGDGDGDEEQLPIAARTSSSSFSPLAQRHSGAYSDDGGELGDAPAAGSGSPFRGVGVGEDPLKALQRRLFRNVHLLKRKWLELQMNANEFSQSLNTLLKVPAHTRI